MNLLNAFKDLAGDQLAGLAGGLIGTSKQETASAMDNVLPALMGGLLGNVTDEKSAGGLMDFLGNNNLNGGLLDNIGDLFGSPEKSSGLMGLGGTILNFLMGNKSNAVIDLLSKATGLDNTKMGSLLKIAAPFLMSFIGKQVTSGKMNAGGLLSLLSSQKDYIKDAAPAGLLGAMGMSGWGDSVSKLVGNVGDSAGKLAGNIGDGAGKLADNIGDSANKLAGNVGDSASKLAGNVGDSASKLAGNVGDGAGKLAGNVGDSAGKLAGNIGDGAGKLAGRVTNAAGDVADAGKSGIQKLLPWLILLLGALGLFWLLKGCNADGVKDAANSALDKTEEMAKKTGDAVGDAANATGDAITGAANATGDALEDAGDAVAAAFKSLTLPGGAEIKSKTGSFIDKVNDYLTGSDVDVKRRFTFDGVNFKTGSAALTEDSADQLNNLVALMTAYKNMAIAVEGHTDNTGNAAANMKLSDQRALSVKKYLMDNGIAAARVAAKGMGQTQPIADNNTDDGKAQNRRVDAYVTKK